MVPDLVSTSWLQENLSDPLLRIVDCRWVLGKPGEGRRQYEAGHVPGAIHLDVEEHLSGKEGAGRHPLPSRFNFEKTISAIGVDRNTHVVAYDEGEGAPAPRLWWLLRFYTHEKVSVLDGGWGLWMREQRPTETAVPEFPKAAFRARPRRRLVADKEAVDSLRDDPEVLLIDTRSPERYRGETETIDTRAGHIPGAENFPFSRTIDPATGRFLPPEKLKEEFQKIGADRAETILCYCGSGITACTGILALKIAGFDAKLYEGSWSDWSRDPNLSIAK